MTSRALSTSSSSIHSNNTSSSATSLLQELHPLPSPDSSVPQPKFTLSDIVFVVGEGDSSREMCEIVDIGYKASEQCYVYDCTPRYNPALQGLFLCRDSDLRKPIFLVGDKVGAAGQQDEMRVLDVRYWSGRFCYKIGKVEGKGRIKAAEDADELLLEEEELLRMVEQRFQENKRP
ncbi:hypothetical protein GJ744_000449 [Endocarpon pusillum]|uniref:Uncharacterized protein n=1 Tax=Endocarpon pusillum TaxID=364733 RepID=A0A8H7ABI3_9EURO|nr:hypothetical protein GJ744_000449 [Endocarpon pusillum]